ncbi:MAG: ribulose-phosphate 3-epimerase [Chloroflexi bacterium]|nr:ribulose-phosphate 3-epimerase [Chloroflexota bacterium]
MGTPTIKLAPSILSADFACLGEQVREAVAAGADYLHIDVMDGHFVPNLTFGPLIVAAVRSVTSIPLDVHLMIDDPDRYLREFAGAGADLLTVHVEACRHLHRTLQTIKGDLGLRAGVALNPATPLAVVEEVLEDGDLVNIGTVNPGFGGQAFIESMLGKVARMRQRLDVGNLAVELEVDGGINERTAPRAVQAGARVLVAGSAVFNARESVAEAVARLRRSIAAGVVQGG